MNDDEINADTGAALPGDQDDASWIEWQAMADYEDGDVALTQREGDEQLFGFRRAGIWYEMLDGAEVARPGYEPTQWTRVPRERWADWAFG